MLILQMTLTKLMGPEGSERFRNDIKKVVEITFDEITKNEPIDLITSLCDRIPSRVYCYWVNAPMGDAEFVSRASHIVQQVHTRNPETTAEVTKSFEELLDYVEHRIKLARKAPGEELLSDLIRATDRGYLSEQELKNWVVKFFAMRV